MIGSAHRFALSAAAALLAAGCQPNVIDEGPTLTARAVLGPKSGSQIQGQASLTQSGGSVGITVDIRGAQAGSYTAMLHEYGDCSALDGSSSGDMWMSGSAMLGQLGTLQTGGDGTGGASFTSSAWTIGGDPSSDVRGHALVIHGPDATGNMMAILACGVIYAPGDVTRLAGGTFPAKGGAWGGFSFFEVGGQTTLHVDLFGATPGPHAFHMHQFADCMNPGGIWNPANGAPALGTLGDIQVGSDGSGSADVTSSVFTVGGSAVTDVLGLAVMVHAGPDGPNHGGPIACAEVSYPGERAPKAVASIGPASGSALSGVALLTGGGNAVTLQIQVANATPGLHPFHIHQLGDCTAADATSAGGHWNPTNSVSGFLGDPGALLYVSSNGTGSAVLTEPLWSVGGSPLTNVLGHALVIHDVTTPARVGCGVINRG